MKSSHNNGKSPKKTPRVVNKCFASVKDYFSSPRIKHAKIYFCTVADPIKSYLLLALQQLVAKQRQYRASVCISFSEFSFSMHPKISSISVCRHLESRNSSAKPFDDRMLLNANKYFFTISCCLCVEDETPERHSTKGTKNVLVT